MKKLNRKKFNIKTPSNRKRRSDGKQIIIIAELLICVLASSVVFTKEAISADAGAEISPLQASMQESPDTEEATESLSKESKTPAALPAGEMTADDSEKNPAGEAEIRTSDPRFWDEVKRSDWRLVLVNKDHPIPEDYTFELTKGNGRIRVDQRIQNDLDRMIAAAKAEGVNLMPVSGYRSYERQESLYWNKVRQLKRKGLAQEAALEIASYTVTLPGCSEHEIGLALDFVTPGHTSLNEEFAETEAGKWLREYSTEYGFILRYPQGKAHITGIVYEPWHFRYVGDYATEIGDSGLTLEEYLEGL